MSGDPNCVFCKIVASEIPAAIVHRDESVVAFLDIGPLAEGHLLIIPRAHGVRLSQLSDSECSQLASVVPRLGRALMQVTKSPAFNLLCNDGTEAGQVVQHVHFHLIPRRSEDSLGYRWKAGSYPVGRAAELAAEFKSVLSSKNP